MSAEECVFCRVVDGTVESCRVYEDDEILAFMDIQPVTDGHLLVIPKRHASHLSTVRKAVASQSATIGSPQLVVVPAPLAPITLSRHGSIDPVSATAGPDGWGSPPSELLCQERSAVAG